MKNISQEMEPTGVPEATASPSFASSLLAQEGSWDPSQQPYLDIPAEPTSIFNHSAPLLCHNHLITAALAMVTIGTVITAVPFPSQEEGYWSSPLITPSTEISYVLRHGSNVEFAAESLKHLVSACPLAISEELVPGAKLCLCTTKHPARCDKIV